MENSDVKKSVRTSYAEIAKTGSSCCNCGPSCCASTDMVEEFSKRG